MPHLADSAPKLGNLISDVLQWSDALDDNWRQGKLTKHDPCIYQVFEGVTAALVVDSEVLRTMLATWRRAHLADSGPNQQN